MINIAICDDELQELECANDMLAKYAYEHSNYDIKIHLFANPLEFSNFVEGHGGFDILLLDIYMPSMLGTEVARELRELGDKAEIIFLTTSRDHAIDAFEVDAAQYLIKPYSQAEFFKALDKVTQRITRDKRDIITLKTSIGITRLSPRDVVFTETGRNNYQIIHTIQGKTLEVRMSTSELFELLSKNKFFVRCGASINLNLKYIRQVSKDAIIFDTDQRLIYPYRSYQKLKGDFLNFQMSRED